MRRLELIAVLHATVMLLLATWAFGGNIGWAQDALTGLGLAGLIVTVAEGSSRRGLGSAAFRSFLWLMPLVLLNLLVLASLLRPSYRSVTIEGAQLFVPLSPTVDGLATARPDLTLRSILLLDALFIPAFNLAVAVRSRAVLRRFLFLFALNAAVLAVFGTFQKLSQAKGLYFGEVPAPNPTFFATFIYHNHWGAYVLLGLSVALGGVFYSARSQARHDWRQSPVFTGILAIAAMAVSVPLSTSRSCTALAAVLLLVALGHGLACLWKSARLGAGARRLITVVAVAVFLGSAFGLYTFTKPAFAPRVAQTRAQLSAYQETGSVGARATLYRDTWNMASDRLLFGWGLGSYGTVFPRYNTQLGPEGLPQIYVDAHSDWLQSVAELGLVGTALRGLMILLPLLALRGSGPLTVLSLYTLFGCLVVLLYAWIEFPFGNTAVILCFWLCFFSGLRLQQLETRTDQAAPPDGGSLRPRRV